jgi:fluoride exporter
MLRESRARFGVFSLPPAKGWCTTGPDPLCSRAASMARFFWVCLGSAVGGGARYLLSEWVSGALGSAFPYGTLAVNLIGSFLIGGLMYAGLEASLLSATTLLALTTGVMGGFTTYSAFSFQTLRSLQQGQLAIAAAYVAVTLVGCLLACWLGWWGARALWSPA